MATKGILMIFVAIIIMTMDTEEAMLADISRNIGVNGVEAGALVKLVQDSLAAKLVQHSLAVAKRV